MNKQQTAVEWLYERFLFAGYAANSEWKEKAKQMEKEQIIKTHLDCWGTNKWSAEKYYNETYGQEREYLKESTCEYSGLRSVQSYDDPKK